MQVCHCQSAVLLVPRVSRISEAQVRDFPGGLSAEYRYLLARPDVVSCCVAASISRLSIQDDHWQISLTNAEDEADLA